MIQIRQPEDALPDVPGRLEQPRHASLGALFRDDATFVNRFGHYVRGVEAIIGLHAPIHATIYSDSTLENQLIDVAAIGDERQHDRVLARVPVGRHRHTRLPCAPSVAA